MADRMTIKELFLFPNYPIIVFNGGEYAKYHLGRVGVYYDGGGMETAFLNSDKNRINKINNRHHRLFGKISELTDKKCEKIFKEARWQYEKYPNYLDPDGERLLSASASLKSFLTSQGWEFTFEKTWIIIPKPSKKLTGNHYDVEFDICKEDFSQQYQTITLPVYMSDISLDSKEVSFNVEIPDFLYDFMMQHPDLEKRPKSKVITSPSFAYLHQALKDLSNDATNLVEHDKALNEAKKIILIKFSSTQGDCRDFNHGGYTGKSTIIQYNFFIGYHLAKTFFNTGKTVYVDKYYNAQMGFVPIKGRYVPVDSSRHIIIEWTQEREDFLQTLENRFKDLSDKLNHFLSDINADKLDKLVAGAGQKLLA